MHTVKTICQTIWQLERRGQLFSWEIDDVFIWELIRLDIFYIVSRKLNILDYHQSRATKKEKIKALFKLVRNFLFQNPLKKCDNKDILFFLHPRKVKFGKYYCDIYSDPFIKDEKNKSIEIFDRMYRGRYFPTMYPTSKLDILDIKIQKAKKISLKAVYFKEEDLQKISWLVNSIHQEFDISIDLVELVKEKIKIHKTSENFFLKLLGKRNPKMIFLVVYYTNMALISACKKKNIEVVEIQHGTTSPYHLGYNFPSKPSLSYFPDKFYSFGEYWIDTLDFPLSKDRVIPFGFNHLYQLVNNHKPFNKNINQILFISQGSISKKIFSFATYFAKEKPSFEVIFKLHPGESYKEYYSEIIKNERIDNLILIKNEKTIYDLLNSVVFVAGVYSTALFESLLFGCKAFVLGINGSEYVEEFVNMGFAELALTKRDLVTKVEGKQKVDKNYTYLFHNYSAV